MAEPVPTGWSDQERAYAEAMRAEVDWAPLHFDGWGRYEQARPALPGESIEVVGRSPDQGYSLQYRPLLGELAEAWQTPIDPLPQITVLGRVEESDLLELRSHASLDLVDHLSETAARMAKANRAIPVEPPVRTGSTIPKHEEIPVHYVPAQGRWLEPGRLIHEDHPSAAYGVAGHWRLRLGRPLGLTPTGLLVFQPLGLDGARLTIEHPISQPVSPKITEGRVGVYRHDGLGGWHQTATVHRIEELGASVTMSNPTFTSRTPAVLHPSMVHSLPS